MQFEIIPPYGLCDLTNYTHISEQECIQYSFTTPLDATNEYFAEVQMPPDLLKDLASSVFGVNGTKVLEAIDLPLLNFNKTEDSSYNKTCTLQSGSKIGMFEFAVHATNGLSKEFINSFGYVFESLCIKANAHTYQPPIITLTSAIVLATACGCFAVYTAAAGLAPKIVEYCTRAPVLPAADIKMSTTHWA